MRTKRTALRIFSKFTNLILESRVGKGRYKDFTRQYGIRTGESCNGDTITRTDSSAWLNSLDTKIYFDAPDWVIESLRKLGFHVLQGIVVSLKKTYTGEKYKNIDNCKYSISNNELFWWLVDYGYKLGENNPIPYELYQLRQTLIAMRDRVKEIIPKVKITVIESEDPIYEAQLLAA